MFNKKLNIAFVFLILWIFIQGLSLINSIELTFHKGNEKKKKRNEYFVLTKTEWEKVKQIEHDELEIKGQMFDVKSISFEKDKVVLLGHFDKKENEIISKHKDIDKKKAEQKSNSNFNFIFAEQEPIFSFYQILEEKNNTNQYFQESILNNYLQKDSPPPKV